MSWNRELPEDQVKGTDGEDLPARLDEAQELQELVETLRHSTNGDGSVRGTIKRIHMADGNPKFVVVIDLPGEDEEQKFAFRRPKSWSPVYDFVRFVEHYGRDVDYLVENEVTVEVNMNENDRGLGEGRNSEYELVYPKSHHPVHKRSWIRAKDLIKSAFDDRRILLPLIVPILIVCTNIVLFSFGTASGQPVINPAFGYWTAVIVESFLQILIIGCSWFMYLVATE